LDGNLSRLLRKRGHQMEEDIERGQGEPESVLRHIGTASGPFGALAGRSAFMRPPVVKALLTCAALLLTTTFAQAQSRTLSGNEWLAQCNRNDAQHCEGYARGIADALQIWEQLAPDSAPACIPNAVLSTQLTAVGRQILTNNAKDLHLWAGQLLAAAYAQAWPCRPPRSKFPDIPGMEKGPPRRSE
jgi:hypothetical protein